MMPDVLFLDLKKSWIESTGSINVDRKFSPEVLLTHLCESEVNREGNENMRDVEVSAICSLHVAVTCQSQTHECDVNFSPQADDLSLTSLTSLTREYDPLDSNSDIFKT